MEEEELDDFEQRLLKEIEEDDQENTVSEEIKKTNKIGEKKMSRLDALKTWKTETETTTKSGGSDKFFKPEEGKNKIRLLPGEYSGLPFVSYHQHYINGKFIVVKSEDNALTQHGWDLHNEYKDKNPEAAKAARSKWLPSKSVAVNILDRADGKVKIWVTSEKRMSEIIDLMDDYGDLFSLDGDGRDIIITRTGTGLSTKYSVVPAPKTEAVEDANEVLDQATDLDDWLRTQYSKEEDLLEIVRNAD